MNNRQRKKHAGDYATHALINGLNIGANLVVRAAGARSERERRAMIWLANYAALRRRPATELYAELGMNRAAVLAALCNPATNLDGFTAAVARLRAEFESKLPALANTSVKREVDAAMRYALKSPRMIEIVGKTRMGKSVCVNDWALRHLDRCVRFECADSGREVHFLTDICRALGIGVSPNFGNRILRHRLNEALRPDGVNVLVVDEGHRLWPANINLQPTRIEFLRRLYNDGEGISVVVVATPQHTTALNHALEHNRRWSPGQYQGRVTPFPLPETMSAADLRAVARHHAPEFGEELIEALVDAALVNEGFCGLMVNVISLARERANGQRVTEAALDRALTQMLINTRLGQEEALRARKSGRGK